MILSKNISPYIRILGCNQNGKYLISEIKKHAPNLPIITSVKKFIDSCNDSKLIDLLNKDILATNVYTLGYESKSYAQLDFTLPIITID